MKRKRMRIVLLLAALGWFIFPKPGLTNSDETIKDLEPVLYNKLQFKKNTDYLHDAGKIEMKNTIPVKQFNVQFDGTRKLPARGDTTSLFREAGRSERSTVAAKSKEIGLFTKEVPIRNGIDGHPNTFQERSADHSGRTIIFVLLIVIGVVVLFTVFIPKIIQASPAEERKRGSHS
ncbi:type VII secretion EssA family protein [Sporosarcina sp. 179-K 3D1 HS]|uniref:type VII secretion EssA family protein n=1 Tax=Sporosarcina sp. 179-K 3D1 HS TaxID=3232169 RepID=UPI00399FAC20